MRVLNGVVYRPWYVGCMYVHLSEESKKTISMLTVTVPLLTFLRHKKAMQCLGI